MPAPIFSLPVFGAAPNQYTTEEGLEGAVNAALLALWSGANANSGKLFSSRAAAVSAGQEALPALVNSILTLEGADLVLRYHNRNGASDDPLFSMQPTWGIAARFPNAAALTASISGLRGELIRNTGNAFSSRAAAVAAGQENLQAARSVIFTFESGVMTARYHSRNDDDPLFTTAPYWGVFARYQQSSAPPEPVAVARNFSDGSNLPRAFAKLARLRAAPAGGDRLRVMTLGSGPIDFRPLS